MNNTGKRALTRQIPHVETLLAHKDQAGSYALLGATVPRDSTIAKKLRLAGAIILGKSNLSQWANFRSLNSTNGWSAHGGQVYAAYHPRQDPSGSSSGSGVSADLGLAFAAVGTETDGSILSPAERNNIVGIKPTVGLTSRHLVIPISEHQDTIGPMARTVRDAAHLLQTLAGQDPRDNYTSAIPHIPDYVAACDEKAIVGARIGVPWNVVSQGRISSAEMKAFRTSIQVLRDAGATIVEANFTIDTSPDYDRNTNVILQADFVTNLAGYLDGLASNPQNVHTLAHIREFTRKTPVEEYPNRDTGAWDPIIDKLGFNNTDARFWAAYQSVLKSAETNGVLGALKRHNVSAVVLPTSLAPDWVAAIGAPGVTVPMGYFPASTPVVMEPRGELVETGPGVPFGLSFLGPRWSEAQLIALAYGFERRTQVRGLVKPLVMPKAEVSISAACRKPKAVHNRTQAVMSQ